MKKLNFLETVRGLCASYVFATHAALAVIGLSGLAAIPFRFGQEAVMIFFVMSGFVIMAATEAEKPTFQTYLKKRWLRIYPIFGLALIVTIIASGRFDLWQAAGNLLMLQDSSFKPGVIVHTFEGNDPLWSLSYEWWFYILFWPAYRLIPVRRQIVIVTIIALAAWAAYNTINFSPLLYIAYWPMWWAGAEIGRSYIRGERFPATAITSLAVLSAAFSIPVITNFNSAIKSGVGMHPILELRHALDCLALCTGVSLLWRRPLNTQGVFVRYGAWVGSISYALYVLHFPIIASPFWFGVSTPVRIIGASIIAVFLSAVAEKYYQPMARKAIQHIRGILPPRRFWRID